MADHEPRLLQPIPRRPFVLRTSTASAEDDDRDSSCPSLSTSLDPANPRTLGSSTPLTSGSSISRPESLMNLTSPTLMGIYSQSTNATSPSIRDQIFADRDGTDTPWGTGAQTPAASPGSDLATGHDGLPFCPSSQPSSPRRTFLHYHHPHYLHPELVEATSTAKAAARLAWLTLRASLLFILGVGYGLLVTRLQDENPSLTELRTGSMEPSCRGWKYLVFWGAAGLVLGLLLPWLDSLSDGETSMPPQGPEVATDGEAKDGVAKPASMPRTDWVLVVRGVGAFVGIIFAIRKLAWASSLQVSATLALVNPLLWWLIDRSKPGLLLSAGVGLAGAAVLLGLGPDMMPAPPGMRLQVGNASASSTRPTSSQSWDSPSSSVIKAGAEPRLLGGLASQETVEAGVWMLSVLFCSCLCFGNIGRRLAGGREAVGRGRWGGLR